MRYCLYLKARVPNADTNAEGKSVRTNTSKASNASSWVASMCTTLRAFIKAAMFRHTKARSAS
eukprot:CAMPEP_0203935758 /NCGR_PEP_ID=MMETSP0359-20131031/73457_1 /ASSEMBLY_ACC=CAM_ASM_000338 /TAXON_ID=268821 /ORGANISM="Scrippsiella Hangoei, Strain SHTV-5" /LENGTH=62 /DNA_ID=CAMNT_0050865647 /DNA_START=40 /DNA_END=225 /DNA_ORIENTATION=+